MNAPQIIEKVERDSHILIGKHHIDYETGWLAPRPHEALPQDPGNADRSAWFELIDKAVSMLPEFVQDGAVGAAINKIPIPSWSFGDLSRQAQYCLMLEISMLTHAFFREQLRYKTMAESHKDKGKKYLCPQLAIPLWQLHKLTGIDPTMAYWLYGLCNWRMIDPSGPMTPENVTPIRTFTNSATEKWFLAIHHIVELIKGRAIRFRLRAHLLSQYGDDTPLGYLTTCLKTSARASMRANAVLGRMEERLDPLAYFEDVRMFYAFPQNVVFEGVEELGGVGQYLEGETGGGSPTHHLDDAVDGIPHREKGRAYIKARRRQMPTEVRELLDEVDKKPQLRELILANQDNDDLIIAYNANVFAKFDWRLEHDGLAARSIAQYGDTHGTGNPVLTLLRDMAEDTRACLIR